MKPKLLASIILILLIAVFVYHAISLSFTQDDAFISYRYVKNFLDGKGLVFNPGERVEGYTNFFFVILLSFFGWIGFDIILVSKIIGIASGAGIIIISYIWMSRLYKNDLIALLPAILLVSNSAFAYWAISGLETVFFAFLALMAVYLGSLNKSSFVVPAVLATLTRPEGGMIFVLIIVYLFLSRSMNLKRLINVVIIYAIFIIPQFIFRIVYYHDFLPNPFYAKTSMSLESIQTGLVYLWSFMEHYGFYGLIVVLPAFVLMRLNRSLRLPFIIVVVYLIYIVAVGGDVLYGARFFIPLLALIYILLISSLEYLLSFLSKHVRQSVIILAVAALVVGTFYIPYDWLRKIRYFEVGLVKKMKHHASFMSAEYKPDLTVACTTIGAFSYYSGAIVIDMLGLTDREIAKHPHPIGDIKSTWKERNYNIPYVMRREPDLILFSTGLKPSAPAERALFLSSKFRRDYYTVFHESDKMHSIWSVFRKKDTTYPEDDYFTDPRFVDFYHEALNLNREDRYELAYEYAYQASKAGPADFYEPIELMADIKLKTGNLDDAMTLFNRVMEISRGYSVMTAYKLSDLYLKAGDTLNSNKCADLVVKYNRLY